MAHAGLLRAEVVDVLGVRRGLQRHAFDDLDRPRDAPWRTGFATAFLTWVFLIFVAGSADRAYVLFGWSYQTQIELYRVLVFVAPVVAFWLARRTCVELLRNERVAADRHQAELEAQAAGHD